MRRLLCFICPPLAALLWGGRSDAALNLLLCALLYVPGVLHAMEIVREFEIRRDWEIRNAGQHVIVRPRKKSDTSICPTPT